MIGRLLLRGMVVGLFAGLLAFGFAKLFGEPEINNAIAFETRMEAQEHGEENGQEHSHAHSHLHGEEAHHTHDHATHDHSASAETSSPEMMPEPEAISRATQAGLGLLTGMTVYGAAMGGLFAIGFACMQGRANGYGARTNSALLALCAFTALVLIPFLKYPANPPAVGQAESIGLRTAWFFIMLALSIGVLLAAIALARWLSTRYRLWNALLIGGSFYCLAVGLLYQLLPSFHEVPPGFDADLLWRFRLASLGIQAIFWTTIGLVFGPLAEQVWEQQTGSMPQFRPRKP
ncbi:CbtA family protein [Beijerinckia mobilis]|uniref:CbtA family protein n=1 Tax=Beijerinckia mobilis TaxID=231434 RepID=UPI00055390B8|nr:CbtA family protein [Beijerinckia mobilis]